MHEAIKVENLDIGSYCVGNIWDPAGQEPLGWSIVYLRLAESDIFCIAIGWFLSYEFDIKIPS